MGDLGLIRSVRRVKLGAGDDRPHGCGDDVIVRPSAAKTDEVVEVPVSPRQIAHVSQELRLADPLREIEATVKSHALGDVGEELLHGGDADLLQHVPFLLLGGGYVVHSRSHASPMCSLYSSGVRCASNSAGSSTSITAIQPSP